MVLCLLMAAGLFGCGSNSAAPGQSGTANTASGGLTNDFKVTMVLMDSGGAAWGVTHENFMKTGAEIGCEFEFLAPTTPGNIPEMVTLAESAITAGTDVLVGGFYDMAVWTDVLQRAEDAGIWTVCLPIEPFPEWDEKLVDAVCGFKATDVAELEATLIDQVVPKDTKITFVYFHGNVTDSTMIAHDAFSAKMKELRPDSVELDWQFDEQNSSVGTDKLNALYKANPELNVVCSMTMSGAMGIWSFVSENNLQEQIYAVGVDASPENLATIKEGALDYVIDQGYAAFGRDTVLCAQKMMSGAPWDTYMQGEMIAIGADNVDEIAEQFGYELPDL
jgi:ABC-type sugar transport system substrate-binding protein